MIELDGEVYKEGALEGKGVSEKVYPGIWELDFVVYEFWKKNSSNSSNNNFIEE